MIFIKVIFTILFTAILLGATSGVWAFWNFASGADATQQSESIGMGVFEYKADEILPGGDHNTGEVELGGNHFVLVDLVLNENDKGYGLNINDNVVLHVYLRRQGVVYSNQKVSGGNLKFILDPNNNTHGLYYCVEYVTDTLYYAYTFSLSDMTTAAGTNNEIIVYRTDLVKTDIWRASTSFVGHANVKSLQDLGVSADPQSVPYSIDVSTWHREHGPIL